MLLCRCSGKCNCCLPLGAHPSKNTIAGYNFRDIYRMAGAMDLERRAFLTFLSAALAVRSIPTNAQPATRLRTVGVLMGLANDAETQGRAKVIEQGLAKKGWVVGQNVSTWNIGLLPATSNACYSFSKELVALHPDVIIGHSTPVVAALLQDYTDNSDRIRRCMPILSAAASSQASARPGGNVTGFHQSAANDYRQISIDTKSTKTATLRARGHNV